MGKVVGLVGAASGKIGNFVYAVSNGIQIARVYQPNVTNPKTSLQSAQRAKGNLAGRISSFVPKSAIYGLGTNGRMRRGYFLSNILRNAIVTQSGSDFNAKIADDAVVFSKGTTTLSVAFDEFVVDANLIEVGLTGLTSARMTPEQYAASLTRVVVMIYDVNNNLVEVMTKIATKPTQGTKSFTIFPVSISGGFTAVAYLVPMSTLDGTAVSVSTSMVGLSDSDIAAALSLNAAAVVFSYGNSVCIGNVTYTPQS